MCDCKSLIPRNAVPIIEFNPQPGSAVFQALTEKGGQPNPPSATRCRPIALPDPPKLLQRRANVSSMRPVAVATLKASNEVRHRPRSVALCLRQRSHQLLDLVDERCQVSKGAAQVLARCCRLRRMVAIVRFSQGFQLSDVALQVCRHVSLSSYTGGWFLPHIM